MFSGHVFPLKITRGKQSRMTGKSCSTKEYIYVWLGIHYLLILIEIGTFIL